MRPAAVILWVGTMHSLAYGAYVISVGGTALTGYSERGRSFVRLFGQLHEVDSHTFGISLWWGRVWVLSVLAMMLAALVLHQDYDRKRE